MTPEGLKTLWQKNGAVVLIGLYFFSLPFGQTLWLPLLIMSILGIRDFIRDLSQKSYPTHSGLLLVLALCFVLPALISLPDSLVFSRTLGYLSTYPLFMGVGYFVLSRVPRGAQLLALLHLIALIAAFWAVTALWQYLLPASSPFEPTPMGYEGRYQGIFGHSKMILGYVLAPIFPFVVWGYWHCKRYALSVGLGVLIAVACLISGNRASWVSIIAVLLAVPLILLMGGYKVRARMLFISLLVLVSVTFAGMKLVSGTFLEERIQFTLEFFKSPSFETFDYASAWRGEIWSTAARIGLENPINGTGADTFRYAHPYYAPDTTMFSAPNPDTESPHKFIGALYPHQLLLQVFAGAGWIGLLGALIFYAVLTYLTLLTIRARHILATGGTLAVWAGFFPFNTHLNFYASWLTASFWVWVPICLALCAQAVDQRPDRRRGLLR